MSEVKWIIYKGKEILFEDYSNEKDASAMLSTIQHAIDEVVNSGRKDVLILADTTNMHYNDEIVEAFKKESQEQKPYIKKNAVLGITPMKRVFIKMVGKMIGLHMEPFKTKEEALEWLVKD